MFSRTETEFVRDLENTLFVVESESTCNCESTLSTAETVSVRECECTSCIAEAESACECKSQESEKLPTEVRSQLYNVSP